MPFREARQTPRQASGKGDGKREESNDEELETGTKGGGARENPGNIELCLQAPVVL